MGPWVPIGTQVSATSGPTSPRARDPFHTVASRALESQHSPGNSKTAQTFRSMLASPSLRGVEGDNDVLSWVHSHAKWALSPQCSAPHGQAQQGRLPFPAAGPQLPSAPSTSLCSPSLVGSPLGGWRQAPESHQEGHPAIAGVGPRARRPPANRCRASPRGQPHDTIPLSVVTFP